MKRLFMPVTFLTTKTFAAALLVLVAIDLYLSAAHPLARVSTAGLERSEAFHAVNGFIRQRAGDGGDPFVALLGSSLVAVPVMQAESSHLEEPIARFHHRRSLVFEELISSYLGAPGRCELRSYCLAVGGAMASDAYLIASKVLMPASPACIIYGIGPRDFQDNLVPGIHSTATFQTLASPGDLGELFANQPMPWEKQLDVFVGRFWRLWRLRADIQAYLTLRAKKLLEKICPWIVFEKYGPDMQLRPRRKGRFPEEAIGTPHAYPGKALDHFTRQDTLRQYLRSYRPANESMSAAQFRYFERLLELAQDGRCLLVIVNMPLSKANVDLLPPGFYRRYLNEVRSLCARHRIRFVDLNVAEWNADENFVDTVHLRPEVSRQFLASIAAAVPRLELKLAAGRTVPGRRRMASSTWPGTR